jgi:hypothetical protein
MYPWFWIFWAPHFFFPWSGSVAQRIEPHLFDAILPEAGDGRIERKAFDVATYGRQLGLITEVLASLAENAQHADALSPDALASFQRLKQIAQRIEKIKADDLEWFASAVEDRLRSLERSNPPAFTRLSARLRPLLGS